MISASDKGVTTINTTNPKASGQYRRVSLQASVEPCSNTPAAGSKRETDKNGSTKKWDSEEGYKGLSGSCQLSLRDVINGFAQQKARGKQLQ